MQISPILIRALIELEDFCDLTQDKETYDKMMSMTLGDIRRLADIQLSADMAQSLLYAALDSSLKDDIEELFGTIHDGSVH